MNQIIFTPAEDDFVALMKKEMLEDRKTKELKYNYNFIECRPVPGKLIWEIPESDYKKPE